MEKYKTYRHIEKEKPITRVVLFEKCRKHDFENNGLKYWYNRNGDVIRVDDNDSSIDMKQYLIGYKGNSYMDIGYVYAPYIPAQLTEPILDFSPQKGAISRYTKKKINTSYYGVVSL